MDASKINVWRCDGCGLMRLELDLGMTACKCGAGKWSVFDVAAALKASEERARKAEDEEEELRELVARYQEASGIDVGGDPGGVTPDILSKFVQSEEARANAAEKQCAELAAANLAANKRIVELEQERDEAQQQLRKIGEAYNAECSMGGEPEPALTCMLLALKQIRDQKQQMRDGFNYLIAERDAARNQLAPYLEWSCKTCGCTFGNKLTRADKILPAEECTTCFENHILVAQRDAARAELEAERRKGCGNG